MRKTDRASTPNLTTTAPEVYLSSVSERDKPWDIHRANSDRVSQLYAGSEFEKYGSRMGTCSQWLGFAPTTNKEGSLDLKLRFAFFCRVRTCPVCQWRRSLMWTARFFQAIPKIQAVHPDARFVFLTLTVQNCAIADLRTTLRDMNAAWKRLSERKAFPAIGWVKAIEVTAVYDCYNGSTFVGRHGSTWVDKWQSQHKRRLRLEITDEVHPHIHVMLMVPPSYFKKNYLSQAAWTDLWRKSLRVEYTPIVNVKAVKSRPGHESGDSTAGIAAGILETLKYAVKESDLLADRDWLIEVTRQLHKTRAIAVGGVLKQLIRDDDPEDLIHGDESEALEETFTELYFRWLREPQQYVMRYVDEPPNQT